MVEKAKEMVVGYQNDGVDEVRKPEVSELGCINSDITPPVTAKRRSGNPAWKKGVSGNPAGRPKVVAHVRDLARRHTDDAIATLVSIMNDVDAPEPSRVSAANALLARGWGQPLPDGAFPNIGIQVNVDARQQTAILQKIDLSPEAKEALSQAMKLLEAPNDRQLIDAFEAKIVKPLGPEAEAILDDWRKLFDGDEPAVIDAVATEVPALPGPDMPRRDRT